MTYKRTFSIDVGLNPFESHYFAFRDIAVDTAIFFKANGGVTSADINQILPRSMSLRTIYGGDGANFSFLSQVEVSVFDDKLTPSSEQIIFFRDDVPLSNNPQLLLIANNQDVKKLFFSGNHYVLRIKMRLREIPNRSIDTEWNLTFLATNNN